jgi:hypothetical protein
MNQSRALKFSREWADESSEDAEAKSFWDAFFKVFGANPPGMMVYIDRLHAAYEDQNRWPCNII